jgi:PhnB protein
MADQRRIDVAAVEAMLRGLPREEFRLRLRKELERITTMTATVTASYRKEGFHDLTPYFVVQGAAQFIGFLKAAFGGEEILRAPAEGPIMHAEMRIGDSMVELADANERFAAMRSAIHLYVPDADAVYARAIEAGAGSLYAPGDKPYGDREGGVTDPFGNQWFIGTHQSGSYAPPGLRSVTPGFLVHGADSMIAFLRQGLGAGEGEVHRSPDGVVVHAKIPIGDSILELSEAHGPWQPMPSSLHLYVEDARATFERALAAGATALYPVEDRPYGERNGGVVDPFGNIWCIATWTGVR